MTEHVPGQAADPDVHANEIAGNEGHHGAGVAVDLNAVLLKPTVRLPLSAVAESVGADETTRWYVLAEGGSFVLADTPPAEAEVVLLVRCPPAREPGMACVASGLPARERVRCGPSRIAGSHPVRADYCRW